MKVSKESRVQEPERSGFAGEVDDDTWDFSVGSPIRQLTLYSVRWKMGRVVQLSVRNTLREF